MLQNLVFPTINTEQADTYTYTHARVHTHTHTHRVTTIALNRLTFKTGKSISLILENTLMILLHMG